jgi:hypothetical protein
VRNPLACTLSAEAESDRVEEWRGFLRGSIAVVERTNDRQLRLRLVDATTALTTAVDLAQREKACCAFFEFSIEVDAASCWFVVRVPPGASDLLADFAARIPAAH